MNTTCDEIRARLLEADDPHPDHCDRPDLREHLWACDACRSYALKLAGIEDRVRAVATPQQAIHAREEFVRGHTPAISPSPMLPPSHSFRTRWLGIATAVALLFGTSALLLIPSNSANAAPAVMERLVDWNVRLSDAGTRGEREELYREQATTLRQDMTKTVLSDAERALAERLLANGAFLVESEDPLNEAERFQDLADHLMDKVESSGGTPSYAKLYVVVKDRGVKANMAKAEIRKEIKDERREQRMQNIAKREAQQENRLDAVERKIKKQIRAAKK